LGESQSQGARIPPSRLNPPDAPKTLQPSLMFPDRLSEVRQAIEDSDIISVVLPNIISVVLPNIDDLARRD
jgi:hypothetical protein